MSYPDGVETKILTGKYAELFYNRQTNQVENTPTEGWVYLFPAALEIKIDDVIYSLEELNPMRVRLESDGSFQAEVIITDQDGILPNNGWTYKVVTSWGEQSANVPILTDMPDPIDMSDFFETVEVPGMIVTKGDPGVSITNITAVNTTATVHYSDGSTTTFELPVGSGITTWEEFVTITSGTPDTTKYLRGDGFWAVPPGGGGGGVNQYEHVQNSPEADWTIVHGLGRKIASAYVTVGTGVGAEQVYALYTIIDNNTIVVHHSSPCSGTAIVQ